jgi:uncharacterized protein YndB with AHSA1/START domain
MSTETQDTNTTVETSIVVEAPVERAFSVFTEQFGEIKPPEHNMLPVPLAGTAIEPRAGGHVCDRGADGSEFRWARVLAYEPPSRLTISWDFSPQWEIQTENTSEVDIRFVPETPERTRVELEHRGLDRHGDGWEAMKTAVQGEQGWTLYLQRFAEVIGRQS